MTPGGAPARRRGWIAGAVFLLDVAGLSACSSLVPPAEVAQVHERVRQQVRYARSDIPIGAIRPATVAGDCDEIAFRVLEEWRALGHDGFVAVYAGRSGGLHAVAVTGDGRWVSDSNAPHLARWTPPPAYLAFRPVHGALRAVAIYRDGVLAVTLPGGGP